MSQTKNVIQQYQLYSQTGVAADFFTNIVYVTRLDNVAFEIIFANATSTPSGTFTVQAAIGNSSQASSGFTWTDLTLSGTPTVNTASGSHMISLNQVPFNALRIHYVANPATSADITINVEARVL